MPPPLTRDGTICTVAFMVASMAYSGFAQIVESWPRGQAGLAEALKLRQGHVRKWRERDFIPAEYWEELLSIAPRCGVELDGPTLIRLAAVKRKS